MQPVKTDISVAGPAGIALNVDGQIRPLPAFFESVVGMVRTIQAPEIQQLGNTVYLFDHWHDGSTDPLIAFATPETPVAMEAFFNTYTLGTGTGLQGQYFIDPDGDLDEPPVLTRTDTTVNFNWGDGSPDVSVPANYFTARWTGFVEPLFSETYTFTVFSDDGCRLWVNDSLIIDKWQPQPPMNNAGSITLEAGQKYRLRRISGNRRRGARTALLEQRPPGAADRAQTTTCILRKTSFRGLLKALRGSTATTTDFGNRASRPSPARQSDSSTP
ncbi:MAG: hypothetical protein IPK76_22105 [Lewinellaceae bacterium]|nr:hypothetical protein [Lewinellaceae bacterium]